MRYEKKKMSIRLEIDVYRQHNNFDEYCSSSLYCYCFIKSNITYVDYVHCPLTFAPSRHVNEKRKLNNQLCL